MNVHAPAARSVTAAAQIDAFDPAPAAALRAALAGAMGEDAPALLLVFASPAADFDALSRAIPEQFPGAPIALCTTAGEIGPRGYAEESIVAFALDPAHFSAEIVRIAPLSAPGCAVPDSPVAATRAALAARRPDLPEEFAFVLVDGLSGREDALMSSLGPALGHIPIFGGSAGDGGAFARTLLGHEGEVLADAALLCIVRTDCPVRVFTLDHFEPTGRRLVVTDADPETRTVRTFNSEPAAREYARLLGLGVGDLGPPIFALRPLVVRLGERHHVRSIQSMDESGALRFFSAIDEGLVLTLSEAGDLGSHLAQQLDRIAAPVPPLAILACDCVFRKLEAEQHQAGARVSDLLSRAKVIGFSTYGEQIGSLHVNQTMTGAAFYPPGTVL